MKTAELFDVAGRITVVTGGASGIGYACAEAMAANGAHVILMDRNPDTLQQAVSALSGYGNVRGVTVDVTDRPALRAVFSEVADAEGRLDVVFANAGISGGPGFLQPDRSRDTARTIEEMKDEDIDRVVRTNYLSVFATVQAAVPHMKAAGGGRIIVTSSVSTVMPEVHVSATYVFSKAGLPQLVRQAALELARHGILVNAMAPGPFATNIANGRLKDPATQDFFGRYSPMHRIGQPQDIQGLALFLASPASRYITGQQIVIDGGLTLGMAD